MTRRAKYILTASIFGASLCLNPAQAVEGGGEPAERESEKTAERDKRERAGKKGERRLGDLESCKRDATDLHGPERARFMTECLRERN